MLPSPRPPATLTDWLPITQWLLLIGCCCLGWTLIVLASVLVHDWLTAPLPFLYLLVSIESMASNAYVYRQRLRREQTTAFRVQEALALFVVALAALTLARIVAGGSGEATKLLDAFLDDPLTLVDRTGVVWLILLSIAWYLPTVPQDMLTRLEPQPGEIGPEKGTQAYDDWLHSPARRFDHQLPFQRLLSLFVASLAAQAVAAGLVWDSFRWSSVGVSAVAATMVYCVSGFMMVALAHRQLRETRWQIDRVDAQAMPAGQWARLNGSLVAALMIVSILIPSALLLLAMRAVLGAILAVAYTLLSFLSIPLPADLTQRLQSEQPPVLPPPQRPPQEIVPQAPLLVPPPWLWSAIVGCILMAIVVVLLWRFRTRLRHPGMLFRAILASAMVICRDVLKLYRFLRHRARQTFERVAATMRRTHGSSVADRVRSTRSRRRLNERQIIRMLFQALLREGSRSGFPRRPGQTAREYASTLRSELPETEVALRDLALAFERASYSAADIDEEEPVRARQLFYTVRDALRAWNRRRQEQRSASR